jgi:hypothetical protein
MKSMTVCIDEARNHYTGNSFIAAFAGNTDF